MTHERCMESICIYIVKRIYKSRRKEFHAHDKSTRAVVYRYKVQYYKDLATRLIYRLQRSF